MRNRRNRQSFIAMGVGAVLFMCFCNGVLLFLAFFPIPKSLFGKYGKIEGQNEQRIRAK
jgi:hypothetical protein